MFQKKKFGAFAGSKSSDENKIQFNIIVDIFRLLLGNRLPATKHIAETIQQLKLNSLLTIYFGCSSATAFRQLNTIFRLFFNCV